MGRPPRQRFQIDAPVDDSFTWMINFIDHGLLAITARQFTH
ncbi:hypothetical protein ACWDXH_30375 [Micromonospora chokoriensis]